MDALIDGHLRSLERMYNHLFHFGPGGGMLQMFVEMYETLSDIRWLEDCPQNVRNKLTAALDQYNLETLNARVRAHVEDLV